jgi:hypothetical protein
MYQQNDATLVLKSLVVHPRGDEQRDGSPVETSHQRQDSSSHCRQVKHKVLSL